MCGFKNKSPVGRYQVTRHVHLPCGKQYSGPVKRVDKLIQMHRRTCSCGSSNQVVWGAVDNSKQFSSTSKNRKNLLQKMLDHTVTAAEWEADAGSPVIIHSDASNRKAKKIHQQRAPTQAKCPRVLVTE